MDLASIIQYLLGQSGRGNVRQAQSVGDMYMPPPEVFSDSEAYPPQFYMARQNPALHDLLFPQESGGPFPDQVSRQQQRGAYDDYAKSRLLEEAHRQMMIQKLKGLL